MAHCIISLKYYYELRSMIKERTSISDDNTYIELINKHFQKMQEINRAVTNNIFKYLNITEK